MSSRIGNIIKFVLAAFFLLFAFGVYYNEKYSKKESPEQEEKKTIKQVETFRPGLSFEGLNVIKKVGSVHPEAKVLVVALTGGSVRDVNFDVGDDVLLDQVLVKMHSESAVTNYSSIQINYANVKNNLNLIERVADKSIRQVEIGIKNAEEAVKSAEITLKTAQDSLENSVALREKGNLDTIDSAIIAFDGYLNFIDTVLDNSNQIIKAEEGSQVYGISSVLSVKNFQSLNKAKSAYLDTRGEYNRIVEKKPTRDTVIDDLREVVDVLADLKVVVDYTIEALDNTIASVNFSQAALNAYLANFSLIRSNVVSTKGEADGRLSGLENLSLGDKNENDALENTVKAAESGLKLAKLGYENALASLESAQVSKEQQLALAETQLNGAKGELDLAITRVSDLNIKAPISGKITGKFVEVGGEVNQGQVVGEISKIDNLKVKISLPYTDIYRIKSGQIVYLGSERLVAQITSIDPVADHATKMVGIDILYNNRDKRLISGTFLEVEIPVDELEKSNDFSFYIPLHSINITQNENFVFIVEDEVAKKRKVLTGKVQGALKKGHL